MAFAVLFFIPAILAILFFTFGKKSITLKEFLLQMAIQAVIAGISVYVIYNRNTWDSEILNGQVVSKTRDEVSCEHSYKCFCYQSCSTDSKGNQSCHEVCQTCYEHSYDVSWRVRADIGTTTISRVDRQGLKEPSRWSVVQIGDPYSDSHSYTNYIKAAPDTLFRHQGLMEKYKDKLPKYPNNLYDYYKIDRTVVVGGTLADLNSWHEGLSKINRDIGKQKEVNMVMVVVFNQPREYFYALEQSWIGGKKNDVALVVGVDNSLSIQWTEVMGWTTNELFKVKLRDSILALKTLEKDSVLKVLKEETHSGFVRRSMKDFEYLEASITPSTTEWIVSVLIGLFCSIGLGVFMHKNDVFNEEGYFSRRY